VGIKLFFLFERIRNFISYENIHATGSVFYEMNKKQHTGLHEILGPNTGTWMLIFIHLAILIALVTIFTNIIARMADF